MLSGKKNERNPNAARIKQHLTKLLKSQKPGSSLEYLKAKRSDGFIAPRGLRIAIDETPHAKPLLLEHKVDCSSSCEFQPLNTLTTPSLLALTGVAPGVVSMQTQSVSFLQLLDEYPSTGVFHDSMLAGIGALEEVPLEEEDYAAFFGGQVSKQTSPTKPQNDQARQLVAHNNSEPIKHTPAAVKETFDDRRALIHPLFPNLRPAKVYDLVPSETAWPLDHRHGILQTSRDADRKQLVLTCREAAGNMKLYSAYAKDRERWENAQRSRQTASV